VSLDPCGSQAPSITSPDSCGPQVPSIMSLDSCGPQAPSPAHDPYVDFFCGTGTPAHICKILWMRGPRLSLDPCGSQAPSIMSLDSCGPQAPSPAHLDLHLLLDPTTLRNASTIQTSVRARIYSCRIGFHNPGFSPCVFDLLEILVDHRRPRLPNSTLLGHSLPAEILPTPPPAIPNPAAEAC
jgi:hypothetical protein